MDDLWCRDIHRRRGDCHASADGGYPVFAARCSRLGVMHAFEVGRRDLAKSAVPATRVVPTLDVGEEGQARLGLGLPAAPVDELAFEAGEEALGHGVVVGVADRSHGRTNAHLLAPLAEGDAGVLATLVAVVDDALGPSLL